MGMGIGPDVVGGGCAGCCWPLCSEKRSARRRSRDEVRRTRVGPGPVGIRAPPIDGGVCHSQYGLWRSKLGDGGPACSRSQGPPGDGGTC